MVKNNKYRVSAVLVSIALLFTHFSGIFMYTAKADGSAISNESLSVKIGDLGQIETLNINNNRKNSRGNETNFVLPNNTSPQNGVEHQWMGEMIFSYRTNETGDFENNNTAFVEVDTNKTLAAGGSTTYSNATASLENNPHINKNVISDSKVEIDFIGQDESSTTERTMKGFDAKSVFNTDTEDGSLLWEVTLTNKGTKYIEFGDVGLPMPWNNKYTSQTSVYNDRVTVHSFAGADSGYAYAIRCSGEGNYMLFAPVAESGARIEYIDNWIGSNNGVTGERTGSLFNNWTADSGGWQPGLSVYYIHSKDIQKTGRGYYTDSTSLVLAPGKSETYQFKFSAIRAGDNSPQEDATSPNNASDVMEERESNLRSTLYDSGVIDAVALPGFQTVINMPTKLDLHYDSSKISDVEVEIQCVHENDPFDAAHIPTQKTGLVNNSNGGRGTHDGNPEYTKACTFVKKTVVDGEEHFIYDLGFGCIGNNSVRVNYKMKVGDEYVDKFTQYEFNVMAELDEAVNTHADFMVNNQQDLDPDSPTYGIYSDWYFASGEDSNTKSHWGDDWSHDNINFITMKNYLLPDADQIKSIETYLIDFMWERYMANTQDTYTVANYLAASSIYSEVESPYTREYSQMMEATGFFNMYRIQKAYPSLIEYRESPQYYLEKAYGIYYNRVNSKSIGFYGEQQIPDMITALREEGMIEESLKLQVKFADEKGTTMSKAQYPYGSEFVYDNTGEEGAYASAKALREFYSGSTYAEQALKKMEMAEWKTRAMRGIQPNWFHYGNVVFLGGEAWWNFQYTASLAGSIMNDWLLYQDTSWDSDQRGWAERVNYAAKLSNFNAINMGQISSDHIGNVSWRYTMYKGGHGAMNVYDGGTRVMNNGWNDFSGEADEGVYGSLLSISSDVVIDPVFGLFGYGCTVDKADKLYTIVPKDGVGKRINVIDEKLYLVSNQDQLSSAKIVDDGSMFELAINNLTKSEHISTIDLSGAGLLDGYYSIKVDGTEVNQCFVKNNQGTASFKLSAAETATVKIERIASGVNEAPVVEVKTPDEEPQAMLTFNLSGLVSDDGAPNGTLTYSWEVLEAPAGATLELKHPVSSITQAVGSKKGAYKVKLTVSDGELSSSAEATFMLGAPPDRKAPVIESVTAVQDAVNISVVKLDGVATADPIYHNELSYEWEVITKPTGANVTLANADKANAYLKADKEGSYTLRFTAVDADTSSYKEVTVVLNGEVDGVERAISVVTKEGVAPILPEKATIILADGTYSEATLEWDAVDPVLYATEGEIELFGKVQGTEIPVKVTVFVVKGDVKNTASAATPSAIINSPHDLGGVAMLNDGVDPVNSSTTSPGVWHNWLGDQGGTAWVQYVWDDAFVATSMDVYVFRDGGGNFRPKDMKISLRDVKGNWYTPRAVEGLGNEINKYNTTSFEPALITGVRIDMKPLTLGCGIIEWKVYGYLENLLDKSELRTTYDMVDAYRAAQFEGDGLAPIAESKAAAFAALNGVATQEEVDNALANLVNDIKKLQPLNGNYAYMGALSSSFTSSWESLPSLNDGSKTSGKHWGTWGNAGASEWVQYSWPSGATIQFSEIYLWTDGGGILMPSSYTYSYLPMENTRSRSGEEWIEIVTIDSNINPNVSNPVAFEEPIFAKAIRCTLNKASADGNGVGAWEWEVYTTQKAELQALYDKAKDIEEAPYTTGSWASFSEALATAKDILEDAENKYVQADVDTALNALSVANGLLVEKATQEELENLETFIELYGSYSENNYSANSWSKFAEELNEAKDILLSPDVVSSSDVASALSELVTAANNLFEKIDISPLEQAVETAKAYLLEEGRNWAEGAANNLQSKINQAETLLANDELTVNEMTDMILALNVAVSEMYEKGDKRALQVLVETAELIQGNVYTDVSWAAVSTALENAKIVLQKDVPSILEVSEAYDTLRSAIKQLKPKDNKTGLQTAINLANAILENKDSYISESIEGLEEARDLAQAVLDDENATRDEINDAIKTLMEKVLNARKPATKTELIELINIIKELDLIPYSDASKKVLEDAITAAQAVVDNDSATQEEIDTEYSALKKAFEQLVKKEDKDKGGTDTKDPDGTTTPSPSPSPSPNTGDRASNKFLLIFVSALGMIFVVSFSKKEKFKR